MTTNSGGLLKRGMEASPSPRLEIRVASPMVYSPPAYSREECTVFQKFRPRLGVGQCRHVRAGEDQIIVIGAISLKLSLP